MIDYKNIREEIARAERFEHPARQMRLTLECGHYSLKPFYMCNGGIGFNTNCKVCSEGRDKAVSRLIVNQEETGVL